jgi:hypothetical protein
VQVTVEIKFEQDRRIVRRPPGISAPRLGKAERGQILLGDEGIQEADGIIRGDIILEPFGKKQRLGTRQAGDVFHACQTYRKT